VDHTLRKIWSLDAPAEKSEQIANTIYLLSFFLLFWNVVRWFLHLMNMCLQEDVT